MADAASHISWDELKAMIFGLAEQSKDTDRKMQETDRRMQETDRLIRDLRESGQETDRKMQETARELRETGRYIKELSKKIEGIGDKFGYFTEGMALPSMERMLNERFAMENISPRHRVRRAGREQEYDVLAWANGSVSLAIVVEVKSRVRREAIAQLESQLNTLPEMLPEIASKSRIGILAGVDWDAGVREEAQAVPPQAKRFKAKDGTVYQIIRHSKSVEVRSE
jgi:chromosome segregation ATPase